MAAPRPGGRRAPGAAARGRPRRGRPPTIDLEQVVAAAAQLGPEELSVAAVAERIGVSVTGLYRYVRGREDLLHLLGRRAAASLEAPQDDGRPWTDWMLAYAGALRRALEQSGGAISHVHVAASSVPTSIDGIERCLAVLRRAGFSGEQATGALVLVVDCTFGFVHRELQTMAEAQAGRDYRATFHRLLALRGVGELPVLRSLACYVPEVDREFEASIRTVLAGVGTWLADAKHAAKRRSDGRNLMTTRRRLRSGTLRSVLALGLTLAAAAPAAAELGKGSVLDQSSWQEAKDLLPPEMLRHYEEGRFHMKIEEIVPGSYALDESFWKAAKQNDGKYKVDEHGSLVEVATGKVPDYLYGAPFASIDPADPQAALKVLWNFEYAYWSNGSNRLPARLLWLDEGSSSPVRSISLLTVAKVIEGNRVREDNPQQYSRVDRNYLSEPADLHGSATLGWRYKDPTKRDSQWAYVPALRRVRAVSPANRSDGVFGSEMTQDDGFNGFDAKPEDFTYRLVATKDEYMMFSPEAVAGKIPFRPSATGRGWSFDTPVTRWGFEQPDNKEMPWVPLDLVLAKRPVWVIEAVPKDQYYLYGKLLISIDRETYKVSNVVKYDWKGEPVVVFSRVITFGRAPDGYRYVNILGGGRGGAFVENLRQKRATVNAAPEGAVSDVDASVGMEGFQPDTIAHGK